MTIVPARNTQAGLDVIGPGELALIRALDAWILTLAERVGAVERRYPFLLRTEDLDGIDYYENFPHLGLAVSGTDPEQLTDVLSTAGRPLTSLPAHALHPARYMLPSAACYSVYFQLRGQTVPPAGDRHTTVATCFRREEQYEGLRRLLGFSMREIVFIGAAEGARDHLAWAKDEVIAQISRLGLDHRVEVAADPFFDRDGSRARMQLLFPVKEEFIVDGLAIGSVNYHRNFFGDRLGIRLPDGQPVHTSCLAFGLERWAHVLTARFGGARSAAEALVNLR
jgi:seryl-tRNA synthetase